MFTPRLNYLKEQNKIKCKSAISILKLPLHPVAAYSQAVEIVNASRILFISGQLGIEANGTIPPGIAEQAAGVDFDNLVKLTTIIPDPADIPASRPARAAALGDLRPASTLIVAGLASPAWKIEIEGIACD